MAVKTVAGLQRRLAKGGELRFGYSEQATSKTGKTFMRPVKADTIAATTFDEKIARLMSAHYACPPPELWTPQGGGQPKWRVETGLDEIDVMVPPIDGAFSQHYEHWTGGECDRRCDGETLIDPERMRGRACVCGPAGQRDTDQRFCKLTTRVSVMLPWLRSAGTWLLVTHGWNAGTELPGMVDLMQSSQAYQLGRLRLEPRNDRKDGKARHWYVPRLDLHPDGDVTAAALTGVTALMLPSSGAAALPAGPATPADAAEVIEAEFDELPEPEVAPSAPAPKTSAPPSSTAIDEKTAAWTACIEAANARGLTAMSQVLGEFRASQGKSPSEATVEDFRKFLAHLTGAAA